MNHRKPWGLSPISIRLGVSVFQRWRLCNSKISGKANDVNRNITTLNVQEQVALIRNWAFFKDDESDDVETTSKLVNPSNNF